MLLVQAPTLTQARVKIPTQDPDGQEVMGSLSFQHSAQSTEALSVYRRNGFLGRTSVAEGIE